jgi:hypothetical protein
MTPEEDRMDPAAEKCPEGIPGGYRCRRCWERWAVFNWMQAGKSDDDIRERLLASRTIDVFDPSLNPSERPNPSARPKRKWNEPTWISDEQFSRFTDNIVSLVITGAVIFTVLAFLASLILRN